MRPKIESVLYMTGTGIPFRAPVPCFRAIAARALRSAKGLIPVVYEAPSNGAMPEGVCVKQEGKDLKASLESGGELAMR